MVHLGDIKITNCDSSCHASLTIYSLNNVILYSGNEIFDTSDRTCVGVISTRSLLRFGGDLSIFRYKFDFMSFKINVRFGFELLFFFKVEFWIAEKVVACEISLTTSFHFCIRYFREQFSLFEDNFSFVTSVVCGCIWSYVCVKFSLICLYSFRRLWMMMKSCACICMGAFSGWCVSV